MWESTLSLCNNVSVRVLFGFWVLLSVFGNIMRLKLNLCVSSSSVAIPFPFLEVFIIV